MGALVVGAEPVVEVPGLVESVDIDSAGALPLVIVAFLKLLEARGCLAGGADKNDFDAHRFVSERCVA